MKKAYDISEPLSYLLAKKGITAYEFSKRFGINRGAVSQYITGKKKASLARIDSFSEFFQVDREFFIDFDKNKSNYSILVPKEEGEDSVINKIGDSISDALNDLNLNRHKTLLLKNISHCFDLLDRDQKMSLLHEMHCLIEESDEGKKTIDMKENDYALRFMTQVLKDNQKYVSREYIEDILNASKESGIIDAKGYKSFLYGFKIGSNSSLSEEESYKLERLDSLLEVYKDVSSKDLKYDYDCIMYFGELLDSLNKNEYFNAMKKLKSFGVRIEKDNDLANFDIKEDYYLRRIYKVEIDCFDVLIDIVQYMVNKDIESVKKSIEELSVILSRKEEQYERDFVELCKTIEYPYHSTQEIREIESAIDTILRALDKAKR